MTNNEIIKNSVKRINEKIVPQVLSIKREGKGKTIEVDGQFMVTLTTPKEILTFLDGFEFALDKVSKKYVVNITEVSEGEVKFYTHDEYFSTKKEAENYFNHNLENFLHDEEGVYFDDENTDSDEVKEYWWGDNHWKIMLSKINPYAQDY